MAEPNRDLTEDEDEVELASVLRRNIHALRDRRQADREKLSFAEKIAYGVAAWTGSMAFVYAHLFVYSGWTLWNANILPGLASFDPTFVIMATVASVEGIFLSTFILMKQNRAAAEAEQRAALNLHVNLLAEHEVTRLLELLDAVGHRIGVTSASAAELAELKKDVVPEVVLDKLGDGPSQSE